MNYQIPTQAQELEELENDAQTPSPAERIRALNDELRTTGVSNTYVTRGMWAKGSGFVERACAAVRAFDAFNQDNDPWGEHDCAILDVDGERVMFKIDYYDLNGEELSPDPADPKLTKRVLTIMLAEEY
jgi:Protein of unknown function (DUF3768)